MASTNGKSATNGKRPEDGKIRVAVVGVGNCASSLVQGRYYYEDAKQGDFIPGLMHVNLGGYHIRDIEFVAAFDVDKNKVGKDLSEAIFAGQNNTFKFASVPNMNVPVERGMTHDGLGKYLSQVIKKAPGPTADIVKILKERNVDVVVKGLRAVSDGHPLLLCRLQRERVHSSGGLRPGGWRQGPRRVVRRVGQGGRAIELERDEPARLAGDGSKGFNRAGLGVEITHPGTLPSADDARRAG